MRRGQPDGPPRCNLRGTGSPQHAWDARALSPVLPAAKPWGECVSACLRNQGRWPHPLCGPDLVVPGSERWDSFRMLSHRCTHWPAKQRSHLAPNREIREARSGFIEPVAAGFGTQGKRIEPLPFIRRPTFTAMQLSPNRPFAASAGPMRCLRSAVRELPAPGRRRDLRACYQNHATGGKPAVCRLPFRPDKADTTSRKVGTRFSVVVPWPALIGLCLSGADRNERCA